MNSADDRDVLGTPQWTASTARAESAAASSSAHPTRREFIKTGAAALAGVTLGLTASRASSGPRKIRLGVVGGGFGSTFQWHLHPDCVVAAVSDLRPERRDFLMKEYRCAKSYPSLEELVRDKSIDAVAIFTEGPNHLKHVVEALRHGKHVVCAVPAVWGSVEEAEQLLDAVKTSGLIYMMAETSYYQQFTISARKFYEQGLFGEIYDCESQYLHTGLDQLMFENGQRTWRHGIAPMHYPTHDTSHLIGITGERLVQVSCQGWGNDSPILKDNAYKNPFWNETALFRTDRGHSFRVKVWWEGPHQDGVWATWFGTKMAFYAFPDEKDSPLIMRSKGQTKKDSAGYVQDLPTVEKYEQVHWWKTEILPEPLRIPSGHEGSHTFLTHEFIDALMHDRKPAVDVYEALAYTVPGIIAHESALRGGETMKIPQFDPAKA